MSEWISHTTHAGDPNSETIKYWELKKSDGVTTCECGQYFKLVDVPAGQVFSR